MPRRSIVALTGAVVATVAVAACGGNDHKPPGRASSSAKTSSATTIKPGKRVSPEVSAQLEARYSKDAEKTVEKTFGAWQVLGARGDWVYTGGVRGWHFFPGEY